MTTETKINPDDLVYWGEDGDYIAHPGHVDKGAFAAAADARIKSDDPGLEDDELPSAGDDPQHAWFRPITREWFDRNHPCDDADYHAEVFADYVRNGALESCTADAEGAEAWTLIATGA